MKWKYAHILFLILCVLIIYILFMRNEGFQEKDMSDVKGKLIFSSWIDYDLPRGVIEAYFSELFHGCVDKYDEIRIYSIWPKVDSLPQDDSKRILNVQHVGEGDKDSGKNNQLSDLNMFDINIVPGDNPQFNVVAIPFLHLYLYSHNIDTSRLVSPRSYSGNKEKFCLFSVSNAVPQERIQFFKELSKYKMVDSCGKVLNTGVSCPGNYHSSEYKAYISQYKFMICFENSSSKNYLTEKLLVAYDSGAIPIYWGCKNIDDYINRDSILYLNSDYTDHDIQMLVNTIKVLDQDDEQYKKKFEQPLFRDGRIPEMLSMPHLNKVICSKLNEGTEF